MVALGDGPTHLPVGYVRVADGDLEGFAAPFAVEWLQSILARGWEPYLWAQFGEAAPTIGGRGPVLTTRTPDSAGDSPDRAERWVFRHYRRGGLAAPILGDRYVRVGSPRPHAELLASETARSRGLATPRVVAGSVRRSGPFYRADLVTEFVRDARTLADVLLDNRGVSGRVHALHATGLLVRRLEQARVVHRDLNARNVLIRESANVGASAWVIDLDRCTLRGLDDPPPPPVMRRRLERSLRRLGEALTVRLSSGEWGALQAGYDEYA